MDLFMMILRFLLGLPTEAGEVEPIVIHSDGRTSGVRRWLATHRGTRTTVGASTLWQRFMQSHPDSSGTWERLSDDLRTGPGLRARRQEQCRTSRI